MLGSARRRLWPCAHSDEHVLDQAAQEGVVNLLGGRRHPVAAGDFRIVQHRLQQALEMRIAHAGDDAAQFAPHLLGIALRRREVIGELDFAFVHPPHLVDGQLRPVVEDLDDAL